MKEDCWEWNTEGHQPLSEKEELEPAKGSENEPFKKQTVITQKRKEKWFKNKEMVSSVKSSRGASEVISRFGNYQMMKLVSAVSVEWDEKKSGFKCRVKSKSEAMCQVSSLCPSRTILYPSPFCSLSQVLGNINRFPWLHWVWSTVSPGRRLEGRRMRWGYIVPQFPPYRVCCTCSTKGHDSLQQGLDNHSLLPLLRPQSGNSSALLVLRLFTTPVFLYILPTPL